MPRLSKNRSLCIWMNGLYVGRWSINRQGKHEFQYDASWLDSPEARPVSLSLPLAPADFVYSGKIVESYFENLLPDSTEIRQRIRARFGAASLSSFDLLAEIGRDCVGALQILPEFEVPGTLEVLEAREVNESEIESILNRITSNGPMFQAFDDAFRISIAGAQEKTAMLFHGGQWKVPLGSTPTTHILKLPLGRIGAAGIDMSTSIENEWLCSRIVSSLGLATAKCDIARFGDAKVLVVERFDRRFAHDGQWVLRIPQEDFCQANGYSSSQKYEADGGPGIVSIMKFLLGSQNPQRDREAFFKAQIVNWLLAAPDGHAKNYSVFIERQGRFHLTPMYDIMSAYPVIGHGKNRIPPEHLKMAMAFVGKNRHYEWDKIRLSHIRETARRCDYERDAEELILSLLSRVPGALSEISSTLPERFPESVAEPILNGMLKAAQRLAHEVS